jgi:hypothetical protein
MFYPEKCTLCGECLIKCPYLAYPEDKAKIEFKKLIDGESSEVTEKCITCVACNMYCPEDANPFDLINDRQEQTGTFKATKTAIEMFETISTFRSKYKEKDPDRPVLDLCTVGKILPGVIKGQLFDGLSTISGADYFCQIGWVHVGKPSLVKENAQKLVDNIVKTGAKEILCFHDDCYAMLTEKVKEFGINVPFKPIHIIEYLRDYVKDHQDQIKKLNMKVAYQQPCASRYTFEDKDKILDELFELIGVERVNRKYDRIDALCCGGAMMGMENYSKEETLSWRKKNISDAKDHGAEAMVFLCPFCATTLRNSSKRAGMEPYMISNLVRLALGEQLTHGGAGRIYE